ncbi:MAG: UDP-glucuronic acid decarboxylase family protein [Patescibacteria group bacterium]
MAKKNKTIVVTGGAGFLGSHLVERLLRDGNSVICVDNFLTGSKKNIEHLLSNKHLTFKKHDVRKPLRITQHVDEIYNLACPASPVHYQLDPIATFETNIKGAEHALQLAHTHNAKVLQASTSEIYGDPLEHPQRESYWGNVNSIGLRACYDEGKRGAETLFFDYHRVHGVPICVIRIFNTYGPRMAVNDGRVVSNFIIQALRGADITIYGGGEQTRSFQYVDDLIGGMVRMMASDDTGPINIGNPKEFTMHELAEEVLAITKSKSKIIYKKLPADDPKRRRPDIARAKKVLGWAPKVSLHEGLVRTVKYFKSIL